MDANKTQAPETLPLISEMRAANVMRFAKLAARAAKEARAQLPAGEMREELDKAAAALRRYLDLAETQAPETLPLIRITRSGRHGKDFRVALIGGSGYELAAWTEHTIDAARESAMRELPTIRRIEDI